MKKHLLTAALLLLPLLAFAETAWKTYINPRFGFKVSYPAALVASPDPANGDGREYHTKDKEFSLAAFAHFLNGETLDSLWQQELKDLGGSVTYKKKGPDWFVVSGVKAGVEFYHKSHVHEGNFACFQITYPHAKATQYDPWVEKIAKDFVPFLKGDYDRIVK